jgi:hypothetical protein
MGIERVLLMALLMLVLIGILFGLGFVAAWSFLASAILLLVWLAGWRVRIRGGRWFSW